MRRIPWQSHGIDGMESPVRQAGARRTAIEQCLINVNAFFVFRGRAMEDSWGTGAMTKPIPRVARRRREGPVVR